MKIIFYCLGIVGLIIAFQNCGDVSISSKQPINLESKSPVPHSVDIDLCLTAAPDDNKLYDIQSDSYPLIVNLTAIPSKGSYIADTDMDGLPDDLELTPFLVDSDHSISLIDILCYQAGTCPATCTDTTAVQIGLNKCDVLSFTNVNGYNGAYDSDGDGVPDYLEIIRGSDPIKSVQQISPGDSDPDQDGRNNLEEIRDQTDPNYKDTAPSMFRPTVNRIYSAKPGCPAGTLHYQISVSDQPFVQVGEFTDTNPFINHGKTLSRSHAKDENVIMVYVPLTQTTNPQIHRGLVGLFKIKDLRYTNETNVIQFYKLKLTDLEWVDSWSNN